MREMNRFSYLKRISPRKIFLLLFFLILGWVLKSLVPITPVKELSPIKEKEESIDAKRDAMRLEKQELEIEKRRFNSTKSLYEN